MWNAAMRDFERDIIPMCQDEGMGLVPYETLGQGRFQIEAGFKELEANNPGRQGKPKAPEKAVSKVFEKFAKARNTQLTSIATAYILHKTPYTFPLVGSRKFDHIRGNIGALTVSLTDDEIEEIETANPFDYGFPRTFLSGTQFAPDDVPKPAHKPADVWLTNVLTRFDWVQDRSRLRSHETRFHITMISDFQETD